MKFKSVFEIIGPTMIGPSSSHTAGAVRIGHVASALFGELPERVDIYLYGSFMETYRGHGTDVALVGGLLGYDTDDERIITSLATAAEQGMSIEFIEMQEEKKYPNTVVLDLQKADKQLSIEGVSIGGGKIEITAINNFPISLSGDYPALLVFHQDTFGTIANVTRILGNDSINVGAMQVNRKEKGDSALIMCELDEKPNAAIINEIRQVTGVTAVFLMENS
ncbi:L-serine ammonia-lyase, iron-sulfur-dependent subunit beta [Staphylococcus debuckii]|uniref:L-serine ammonia-lyase, iron-sulfur-dependent subunit beta n=1 Tax=Staphylococcus debuckii TaxID=2044912 RepID=UPI000F436C0B|nr:L-serine ammonia-lyase, iron-sulfur-dependent subunit beta [Staphylococcus debuckii]AYU55030.1 L-serine ammonia-lyase, iron-sulfur-dependent, subunit beta [Staphylococcus debuckii]